MKLMIRLFFYSIGFLFLVGMSGQIAEASEAVKSTVEGFSLFKGLVTSIIMIALIVIIATERIHRTMAVFLVATTLIFVSHTVGYFYPDFNFLTLEQAFRSIDGEVIALLTGMMIIVGVLGETGLFQWIAYKLFHISKGDSIKLLVLFMIATGLLSAFLDNVTTMFLITPVALAISRVIGVNPIALIMPMILASNVGGTSTLIGDPPNIMIGSYAKLSFNDFLINLGIPIFFILAALILQMKWVFGKQLREAKKLDFNGTLETLKKDYKIRHFKLLKVSLAVLLFVVIFFLLHGMFHMPAAVPALVGAGILMFLRDMIIIKKGQHEPTVKEMEIGILKAFEKDVEWPVLAFFIFLFMIVGALEHSGMLHQLAIMIQTTFNSNFLLAALVILWMSAIASAFLDNIPFTAVMLPIVSILVTGFNGMGVDGSILWWALAFGACLGGNGTLIGASANIVTIGMLEKQGIKYSFVDFFKVGFPSMLMQMAMATVAIILMIKF